MRAEPPVDAVEVDDVVAVVAVGRGVERHEPQARHAQLGQVVDALGQPRQVAAPVAVGVEERLDVQAVDDRVLPPQVAGVGDPHGAGDPELRQHALAERVDPRRLLLADVVQVEAVEARGPPARAARRRGGPGRSISARRRASPPADVARRLVEVHRELEVPAHRRARRRCCATGRARSRAPPRPSPRRTGAPAGTPARARRVAVGRRARAQRVVRLVDRDQPVGPARRPAGGRRRHGRGEQRRRHRRAASRPGPGRPSRARRG